MLNLTCCLQAGIELKVSDEDDDGDYTAPELFEIMDDIYSCVSSYFTYGHG